MEIDIRIEDLKRALELAEKRGGGADRGNALKNISDES